MGGERRPRPIPYVPALDGLRAVAVVGVLLFHGGVSWVPGGYLGVDVFFVLSGYLITTLLLRERVGTGTVDLVAFWGRRLRRLLPALLALLAVVGVATPFLVEPAQRASVRGDGLAALAYVANWRFVLSEQSYFAGVPSPLRHLWSLSVEEQWYLLFPVVAMLALRRTRHIRAFVVGLSLATVASAAWMAVLAAGEADPSRAYYGTDTRAHTLLVGALLACVAAEWPLHRARRLLAAWGAAGAVAVVAAYALVTEADAWMYQGGFLGLAVATAGVVAAIAVARPAPRLVRVLEVRPLVAIGRVSYGLYLWHWPVNVVLTPDRTGLDGDAWWVAPALLALRTVVAAAFTVASYLLVEQPVRRAGLDGLRLRLPGPARGDVATTAGCVAMVAWLLVAGTLRVPDEGGSTPDAEIGVPQVTGTVTTVADRGDTIGLEPVPGGRPIRTMVTGDSVAFTLTLEPTGVPADIALTGRAIIGCGIVDAAVVTTESVGGLERCKDWPAYWQEGAATSQPDVVVLMFGAWEVFDHMKDGVLLPNGSPELGAAIRAGVDTGVNAVLGVAPDARFLIVGTPCMQPPDTRLGANSPQAPRADPNRVAWVNEQFAAAAAALGPRAAYADLGELLCPGGEFREEIDGVEIRPDGLHYEPETTGPTWAWLAEQVRDLAATPVPTAEVVAPG